VEFNDKPNNVFEESTEQENLTCAESEMSEDVKDISVFKKLIKLISAHKKAVLCVTASVIAAAVVFVLTVTYFIPDYHYTTAKKLINDKNYTEAYFHLLDCRSFKDAETLLGNFRVIHDKEVSCHYSGDGALTYKYVFEYNNRGDQTLYIKYDEKGNIFEKHEYKYDDRGNLLHYIRYDKNGDIRFKEEYKYDDRGNKTFYSESKAGRDTKKCEYVYDENNCLIRSIESNEFEGKWNKKVNDYDKNGNLTLQTIYDVNENLAVKHEYKYDERGLRTQYILHDKDGSILEQAFWEYDKQGNLLLKYSIGKSGNISKDFEYGYDDRGNQILINIYNYKGLFNKEELAYDENSNMILRIVYNSNGDMVFRAEYEYNDKNNMIRDVADRICETGWVQDVFEYDDYGNRTLQALYDENGTLLLEYKDEYEYDEYGNQTFIKNTSNGEVGVPTRYEYEYNEYGDMTLKLRYFGDELREKITYEYTNPRVVYLDNEN